MRRIFLPLLALSVLFASTATLPAQDWAKAALLKSPRHGEYVPLKHGDRSVQAFVVYPEVKQKAPVVLLIHEIFGLSDWAKLMADELAAQGFIVVAPDLLTGAGANGGGTEAIPAADVTRLVSGLSADQVTADLDAAADYAKKIPAANGKLFVAGFCWGGGKSFGYAAHRKDLSAAFVFYGTPPPDVTTVAAPVYGFYAGNDARVTATVPAATEAMKTAGKKYEPVIYDGAGHGFMRAGQDPATNDANKKAWEEGFKRLVATINKINSGGSAAITRRPVHGAAAAVKAVAARSSKPSPAATSATCHEEMPAAPSVESAASSSSSKATHAAAKAPMAGGSMSADMDMATMM